MTLTITVHRGTRQIGGSCIEIAAPDGQRLVLDAGRPLDAARGERGLLPATLDLSRPAHVLISHPHMDHWGLLPELPSTWPFWTGAFSERLMRLTAGLFGEHFPDGIRTWDSRTPALDIAGFRVTPFLTDHSAADAYMLLVERDGTRILYTGDFRTHGRKAALVEAFLARAPRGIDVLLMEGTNLGSDKPVVPEREIEERLLRLARETEGRIFAEWSAQNLDRTVSLYRAARRSGRRLVVDLYTADVLLQAPQGSGLPRPHPEFFSSLLVMVTPGLARRYRMMGRDDLIDRILKSGRATSRAKVARSDAIVMTRASLLRDFERGDALPITAADAFVHSNWSGYLDKADPRSAWAKAEAVGARCELIHTSGHAGAAELSRFAARVAPRFLVPVHGHAWDNPGIPLPPVIRLSDGEAWSVPAVV